MIDQRFTRSHLLLISLLWCTFFVVVAKFVQQSFWVDEAITAWITEGSYDQVVNRSTQFQGQSPFAYLVTWATRQFLGSSEWALRAPSIFFLALTAVGLFQFLRRWTSFEAASAAILLFLSYDSVVRGLAARPYALALCAAVFALLTFLRWLESDKKHWLVVSGVCSLIAWYAHFLFVALFLVEGVWLLYSSTRSWRRVRHFAILLASVMLGSALSWNQFSSLVARGHSLSFLADPGFGNLLFTLVPPTALVILGSGVLVRCFIGSHLCVPRESKQGDAHRMYVALVWALLVPIIFFVHAWLAPGSLFLDRYLLWTVPGVALSAALLFDRYLKGQRMAVWVVVAVGVIASLGRVWRAEDWRGAAAYVRAAGGVGPSVVLVYPGLIEQRDLSLSTPEETRSYLLSPWSYYFPDYDHALTVPLSLHRERDNEEEFLRLKVLPLLASTPNAFLVVLDKKLAKRGTPLGSSTDLYDRFLVDQGFKREEPSFPLTAPGDGSPLRVIRYSKR